MLDHSQTSPETPFTLLSGGLNQCNSTWNKTSDGIDQCYKLYYLTQGQALLKLKTEAILLSQDQAYLIPGHQLVQQECPCQMEVYWIHFVPTSLYMTTSLSRMEKVYQCDLGSLEYWKATCEEIPGLFEDGHQGLLYRVQAMLLDLVSQFLTSENPCNTFAANPVLEQLKPAIAFMDLHLTDNPSLEEIAKNVHLSPNYFHRKFTNTFHITPFNYMLKRRLDLGRQLLLNTNLTLQHIAKRCGFYCEFHFSKTFKKHYSLSPKQFRKQAMP